MTQAIVIRHGKERRSKCTLEPLRGRQDIRFFEAGKGCRFDATGHILLAVEGEVLTRNDAGRPLLILDATWRYLPQLEACLVGEPLRRSLPPEVKTAYPRTSKVFNDPPGGLASVEALYLAKRILGEDDPLLLDHYPWKDAFLAGLRSLNEFI